MPHPPLNGLPECEPEFQRIFGPIRAELAKLKPPEHRQPTKSAEPQQVETTTALRFGDTPPKRERKRRT